MVSRSRCPGRTVPVGRIDGVQRLVIGREGHRATTSLAPTDTVWMSLRVSALNMYISALVPTAAMYFPSALKNALLMELAVRRGERGDERGPCLAGPAGGGGRACG